MCTLETVISFYIAVNKPVIEDTEDMKRLDKMNSLNQVHNVCFQNMYHRHYHNTICTACTCSHRLLHFLLNQTFESINDKIHSDCYYVNGWTWY